jgi:2-oxoisovalerate dehydrogenase E1 component
LKTTATPSAPGRGEHAGRQHLRLVANFPNFHFAEVDGTDPEACLRAFQAAVAHCRAGLGPAFVHGHCVRPYSHSLSDDDKLYRSAAEREADAMRDPIAKMQMRLLREGILTEREINELEQRWTSEAAEAAERALEAPLPEVEAFRCTSTPRTSTPPARLCHRAAQRSGQAGGGNRPASKASAIRAPWPT